VLASQKMVERDKIFAMIGPMGSPTVLGRAGHFFDAGVIAVVSADRGRIHLQVDSRQPRNGLKVQTTFCPMSGVPALPLKYMIERKTFKKSASMIRTRKYGKTLDASPSSSRPMS